jgi:hypothetical protein
MTFVTFFRYSLLPRTYYLRISLPCTEVTSLFVFFRVSYHRTPFLDSVESNQPLFP